MAMTTMFIRIILNRITTVVLIVILTQGLGVATQTMEDITGVRDHAMIDTNDLSFDYSNYGFDVK